MKNKYKVRLCKNCIDDLDEYYPYLEPRENLEIEMVSVEECDNTILENYPIEYYEKMMKDRNDC